MSLKIDYLKNHPDVIESLAKIWQEELGSVWCHEVSLEQVKLKFEQHCHITERYENASTLVTSNLDFSEWGDAFPNRLLAAATLDRLRHNAHRIILDGISFRGGQCDKIKLDEVKKK